MNRRPRLFVSYSHSPDEHAAEVRMLIGDLEGMEALDVHHDGQVVTPQGPEEGWIKWMRDQINEADWVVVIGNEAYLDSWNQEPGAGRGATYEASLLRQILYDDRMLNRKVIPGVMRDSDREYIPVELRNSTSYRFPDDFEKLTAAILRSTWLGRFVGSLGDQGEESEGGLESAPSVTTASEIIDEAEDFEELESQLPALKDFREDLVKEYNEFIGELNRAKTATERARAREKFRQSFCPRVKELMNIMNPLPKILEDIFNRECTAYI